MATKRGVPAEKKATAADVEAAAARLTDAEIAEIYKYAEIRIGVIRGAADSREPHELMNEAFRRTLDLTRTWNMDKPFVQHLRDVIESLSGNWADRYRVQMTQGRDQVVSGRDSRTDEILAATAADPRTEADPLIPSDEEDRESAILRIFEGDQLALDIINGAWMASPPTRSSRSSAGWTKPSTSAKFGGCNARYRRRASGRGQKKEDHVSDGLKTK